MTVCSQFGDLYEEDYFIDYLKDDVRIVKELPFELQSLDLEAIEAVVSSAVISYCETILRLIFLVFGLFSYSS
jgi:hypothetical protein